MNEAVTEEAIDNDIPPLEVEDKVESKKERASLTRERETKVAREMRENEDRSVKDWLESLNPGGAIRVKVNRTHPKMWKGMNVGGNLATYNQQIDEDFLRDHHGGGDFHLEVRKPRPQGGWQFAASRMINIAGDPRTDDVYRDKADQPATAAVPANSSLVEKAFEKTFTTLERQLEQARSQPANGSDAMATTMQLMQKQIDHAFAMLREKDSQLAEAQQVKPAERDEFRDKMLDKLLDGDSARITALRSQYESELRQVKQSAMDNEARLRDSFERDKQALAMMHDREINALRSAYDLKVAAQEQSHSTARTLMDGEIRRLAADLAEAKAELVALRARKDKTIIEQATEFAQIKEALGEITGDDTKEKSTLEKVLEVAGNLPAVQGAIAKYASGEQQPAQPAPPAPPPRPQVRLLTGPDGNLYRQLPTGELQMVRERKRVQAPTNQTPATPNIPEIPATTIKVAVDFLETAYRNGQDPAEVATSVRSMIPAEVLTAIRELGIDGFLTNVAKLDATSTLSSQAGRNWTRKLGKSLLEG
jgi:hypothetical protein